MARNLVSYTGTNQEVTDFVNGREINQEDIVTITQNDNWVTVWYYAAVYYDEEY